jgi:hypothetical protein
MQTILTLQLADLRGTRSILPLGVMPINVKLRKRRILIYNKLGGSSPECWLADSRDISDRIPRVWQNTYLYCSNYVGNKFIIAIRHLKRFMIHGQYATDKGCMRMQTLRVVSWLRTALSRGILAIYHTSSGLIDYSAHSACVSNGTLSPIKCSQK